MIEWIKKLWRRFKCWLFSLRWLRPFRRGIDVDLVARVALLYSLEYRIESDRVVFWRMKGTRALWEKSFCSVEDLLIEFPLTRSNV